MRVSKLLGLVPSVIQESQITAQQLTDLVDLYKDDLPSPQLFFAEFERWKMKVQARIITADSCAGSLKACGPDDFPNLYILLKIATTLLVISYECERSISTMRRLNKYMRCTMGESRLSPLAIYHAYQVRTERSGVTGGLTLLLRDTLQHPSSFVKRFVYLAGMYH